MVCGCVVWCVCRVLCGVVWLWGSPKSQQNILGLIPQERILVLCSRVLVAQYLVTLDEMPTNIFSCRDFRNKGELRFVILNVSHKFFVADTRKNMRFGCYLCSGAKGGQSPVKHRPQAFVFPSLPTSGLSTCKRSLDQTINIREQK